MGERTRKNRIALAEVQPGETPGTSERLAGLARLSRYYRDRQPELPEAGFSELLEIVQTLIEVPGPFAAFAAKDGRPYFRVTYAGMARLALRDPALVSFQARVVYDNDTLAADYGSGILTHAPTLGEPGAVLGCYVQAGLMNGARPWDFYRGAVLVGAVLAADSADEGPGGAEEVIRRCAVRRYVASSPLALQALRWALDAEAQSAAGSEIILPWLPAKEETAPESA